MNLLYRGSEVNFTHADFSRLVGNQGRTLHIIKSEHDYLFGGCAYQKYPKGYECRREDPKAFLFQLYPNQIKIK